MFVLTQKKDRVINLAKYRSVEIIEGNSMFGGTQGHYYLVAYIDSTSGKQMNRTDLDIIAEFEDGLEASEALQRIAAEMGCHLEF